MENSGKTFTNCPKCQAEVRFINLGGISYEECPNCEGIFVDFHETDNDYVADVLSVSSSNELRRDRKTLDEMVINCPKCKVEMKKKPISKKKDVSIDSCPECKGIWFDKGEFAAHLNPVVGLVMRPSPFKIWYECESCKIFKNVNETKEREGGSPLCPRCQKPLQYNCVRMDDGKEFRRDMTAIATWVSVSIVSFVLTNMVLKNALGATFFTFVFVGLLYMLLSMANVSKKIREGSVDEESITEKYK